MDGFPRNLVCSFGDSSPSKFLQIMTLVDLDNIYAKVKFGYKGFSIGKVKAVDFSDSIAAFDLKDGTYRQLIDLMKVSEN